MDSLIIRLLMLIMSLVVTAIVGHYRHRGISYGDPITFCILCPFFILSLLYEWKNKFELVKQCALAAPFATLLSIVVKVVGFDMDTSIYAGIIIFLFLVMKTDNWKRHFFITSMTALVFTFLFAYLQQHLRHGDLSEYRAYIIFGLGWPFGAFYVAYLGAIRPQKTIELRPLLRKASKFAGATFLLLTLFLISHKLCRHYRLGLAISFTISVLLSLGFLGGCYWFKINLSDSSVSNKNNEITNKKFLDELKKRFYVFRGKNEKTDKVGKCEFCGRPICSSDVSHAIKDHTICEQCYKKIEEEKARIT